MDELEDGFGPADAQQIGRIAASILVDYLGVEVSKAVVRVAIGDAFRSEGWNAEALRIGKSGTLVMVHDIYKGRK